jgi:hypothetical protein
MMAYTSNPSYLSYLRGRGKRIVVTGQPKGKKREREKRAGGLYL